MFQSFHILNTSYSYHISPTLAKKRGFWLVNSQFPESSGAILTELQVVAGVRLERSQHGPTWGRSAPRGLQALGESTEPWNHGLYPLVMSK